MFRLERILILSLLLSLTLVISQQRYTVAAEKTYWKLDVEKKIDALMAQMTLEEKVGQLVQWSEAYEDSENGLVLRKDRSDQIRAGNVGSLLNVWGAERTREVQRIAVEESRLKIPLLFGLDVIHGYHTTMPIPLAEAATFNPQLVEESARIAAKEAAAAGVHWTFAPMVDITREPRWGRIAEGSGEDPYLGSVLAAARVRGFQGEDLADPSTIAACAKHFLGYGFVEGGRDYNTADVSERTVREIVLPPFRDAIDAGVTTLMSSFNEIGGEPTSGSRFYLTKILREELGFRGFLVSDWNSVGELVQHGVATTPYEAAVRGLQAGVDMDMEGGVFLNHVPAAIKSGSLTEDGLNEAVRRVLRVKFRLNLFENPYRGANPDLEKKLALSSEHRAHALAIARETIVLLKNEDGVLPFSKNIRSVAIIGPMADDAENLLGTWTTKLARKEDVVSIYEGIRRALPNAKVMSVQGCNYDGTDRTRIAAAVRAAKRAEAVILAVGETKTMSGEANNRASIELPGVQEDLILQVLKLGKPTAVVVLSGRPNALERVAGAARALLVAWHPGVEAGNAVAQVLFGDYNPSGKLPATFPRVTGHIPLYYNHKNTGRPPKPGDPYTSRYIDGPADPLFPFGYGLSYTTFEYTNLRLSSDKMTQGEKLVVTVTVKNTGNQKGQDVAQLYIRDLVGSVTRPVRELKGFQKIDLQPGETRDVTFTITEENLMIYDIFMKRVVETGDFEVYVGNSSRADLKKTFSYHLP